MPTALADTVKLRLPAIERMFASGPGDPDTERAQAVVRLVLAAIVTGYILVGIATGIAPEGVAPLLVAYFVGFLVIASALYLWIVRRPGIKHHRRALTMGLDYGSITITMLTGGEFMAPVYATLLWVTVGYGMRYGSPYLAIGTTLALASLTVLATFSSYWNAHPYLVATMAVTTIIVPAYARILLKDVRNSYDAAVAANLAKSRFLAQASHDLRQPVHAISLFTACLRDSGLGEDQRQMVENIDRSLHSVSRLFRSLLDIATLDSGKVRPRHEPIAVAALLKDVAAQNAEAARWAGVEIRVVPSALNFQADPGLMMTILQNIVSNALKYAPGKPVLMGCRRKGAKFSIWVCDQGPGIPYCEQGRVFEEFYRSVEPGKDVEGVGLGLPIVLRMATLMGFSVHLRSVPGRGTTVAIENIVPTRAAPVAGAARRAAPVTLLHGIRILLIEDDVDVLLATRTLLERWGCVVQPATALPDALEACDLVITDYDLNGPMTGAECIRDVRARLGIDIPAIIMTGHDEGRIMEIIDDPDIPILSKPVRPAELRAALMGYKFGVGLDRRAAG